MANLVPHILISSFFFCKRSFTHQRGFIFQLFSEAFIFFCIVSHDMDSWKRFDCYGDLLVYFFLSLIWTIIGFWYISVSGFNVFQDSRLRNWFQFFWLILIIIYLVVFGRLCLVLEIIELGGWCHPNFFFVFLLCFGLGGVNAQVPFWAIVNVLNSKKLPQPSSFPFLPILGG